MIEIKNLSKTFDTSQKVHALKDVSLSIADGDIFGIIGMSGAGKSTLVRCINLLEKPTSGQILIDGIDMTSLSEKELRKMRRKITMIFQNFNLLMQKNCLKNIMFPLELEKVDSKTAKKRALELLEIVGLKDKAKAYPSQLSGGQKQRVAIARALATNPEVLLCDEATSALDPSTTHSILQLIKQINEKLNITCIVITHQMNVIEEICKNVAILDNGEIVEQGSTSEIFADPKSDAAKKLVFPESVNDNIKPNFEDEHLLRVVFTNSETAVTPLIARMAKQENIEANIMGASTKTIDSKAFGFMLLGIRGDDEVLRRALDFLNSSQGVRAKEINK
ncbi:MAG: ATP-binding cassette domain-containing protein [Clostridia bacterium]|nr:ATP-binding cassette domain-containing protein [Clostridia bacterium]